MIADVHRFPNLNRQRVAIIGSGISGLSTAWAIQDHCDVTIFERNAYIGGHTNTAIFEAPEGPTLVDTGFIVYNEPNYPNLTALFETLDVASNQTKMHFSVSAHDSGIEYGSNGLSGLFADRRNVLRPRFYAMIMDIMRFYRAAPKLATGGDAISIGEFLASQKFGRTFIDNHLLPMAAAIWSCPPDEVMNFPAKSLARFFVNHGLVELGTPFMWRSVDGGSSSYIPKLTMDFAHNIRLNCPVKEVRRNNENVQITLNNGETEVFDQVVLAVHGPQANALLSNATPPERDILSVFKTQPNKAVLHTDEGLMPARKDAWASWNYLTQSGTQSNLSVTYWMNQLQKLRTKSDVFVTLNPCREPVASKVIGEYSYEHPIFDAAAMNAQREIWTIQGNGGIWYAGAWLGFGFHEDGLECGLAVAESMTPWRRPWTFDYTRERIQRDLQNQSRFVEKAA